MNFFQKKIEFGMALYRLYLLVKIHCIIYMYKIFGQNDVAHVSNVAHGQFMNILFSFYFSRHSEKKGKPPPRPTDPPAKPWIWLRHLHVVFNKINFGVLLLCRGSKVRYNFCCSHAETKWCVRLYKIILYPIFT